MVGALPEGLPLPSVGGVTWQDVGHLIGPAAGIALIAFADTGVLSRTFAARHGEDVNGSTEMKAIGVANVAGGLFGGFPISASGSRTPVAEQSGAHTQLAGVVGGARGPGVRPRRSRTHGISARCNTGRRRHRRRVCTDRRGRHGPHVAHEHRGIRPRRRGVSGRRPGRCATRHPCSDRTVPSQRSSRRYGSHIEPKLVETGETRRIPRHRTPSRWASHPRPGVGEV